MIIFKPLVEINFRLLYLYTLNCHATKQNLSEFYQRNNQNFLIILFGLSAIAWTVRAVNFLDLIVENGYSVMTYFQYSFFNLFGILTKFIPLAFLISLLIFIMKQLRENEFVILWVSGVKNKKLQTYFFSSLF